MQRFVASRAAAAAAAASSAAVLSAAAAASGPARCSAAVGAAAALPRAQARALPHTALSRSSVRHASTSTSTAPQQSSSSADRLAQRTPAASSGDARAVANFVDLGLPRPLARQLIASFPHIHGPTLAQTALLEALPNPNDIILRAHTGTGKSFSLLLGLLAKPRVLFARTAGSSDEAGAQPHQHGIASIVIVPSNELAFQYYSWAKTLLPQQGDDLHPIIQVAVRGHPTLSAQAQVNLLRNSPPHLLVATPTRLIEILSMKTNDGAALLGLPTLRTLALDEADALLDLPGRFPTHKLKWKHTVHPAPALIFLNEVMRLRPTCSGGQLLPSAGLEREDSRFFDERRPPEDIRRTLHRSREALSKQQQARKQEASAHSFYSAFNFALPRPRYGPTGSPPVQLVVTSATANAVLRHFFGARTGWLRTGVKDSVGKPHGQSSQSARARQERITGVWLDLTGLTKASAELTSALAAKDAKRKKKATSDVDGQTSFPTGAEGSISAKLRQEARKVEHVDETAFPRTMPEELTHYCLVVDEPDPSGAVSPAPTPDDGNASTSGAHEPAELVLPPIRNLDPRAFIRPFRKARDLVAASGQPDLATTVRSIAVPAHEVDAHLLAALAFAFASDSCARGLALIPAQWSLRKAKEVLEGLGVPVRTVDDGVAGSGAPAAGSEPVLYLLQATSARGLDLPVLSHVFIVGVEAIGDSVRYTHMAGRASRIGANAELAKIPALPSSAQDGATGGSSGESGSVQPLRPLAKVVTLLRGLPHEAVRRRRAALHAWAQLSKTERIELGRKKPQHDAIMVSSAERKMWTIWRRTGVTGRKGGVGGMGKWDLRLVGGEAAAMEEAALADWDPAEEAREAGLVEADDDEELIEEIDEEDEEEEEEEDHDDGKWARSREPDRRPSPGQVFSRTEKPGRRPYDSAPRRFEKRTPVRNARSVAPRPARRVSTEDRLEFGDHARSRPGSFRH